MMLFAALACAALTVVTFLAVPRAAEARRLVRLARPRSEGPSRMDRPAEQS